MNIRYADDHEGLDQALFASAAGVDADGPGDWVQLSPSRPEPATLTTRRDAVEAAGGRLLAVVPEALLWPRLLPDAERFLHVDCRRDHARISVVEGGERLALVRTVDESGAGVQTLEKRVKLGVAEHSVRETRYDPMHNGAAERELNRRLVEGIGDLLSGRDLPLQLGSERLRLSPDLLTGWCQPVWTQLVASLRREFSAGTAILVSPGAAKLPNLESALMAAFGEAVTSIPISESRDAATLGAWLEADLPGYGCWLLQTRPRTI